jgi:isocitrate dehydrogenase
MPDGFGVLNVAALAGTVQADTATAAVTSVGLFSGNQIFVGLTNTATASSTATLLDLHIETLQ